MPTIGSNSKPAYVYDAQTDTWIPIGPGEHTHQYIDKNVITTAGDILYASAANTPARLGIGSSGQVLTVASGIPSWAAAAASIPANAVDIIDTSETTTSTTFTDLATVGPSVTLTTGTKALVTITSYIHNSTNSTENFIGFAVSGATTIAADSTRCLFLSNTSTGNGRPELRYSYSYILTGLTAGSNTFTLKYRCSSGTLRAQNRIISVVDMGS